MKTYGLTLADYDTILEFQEGVCPVCGKGFAAGTTPHIDHEHGGHVRGLVHSYCNTRLIGRLKDWQTAQRLADYLRDPPATKALGGCGTGSGSHRQEAETEGHPIPENEKLSIAAVLEYYGATSVPEGGRWRPIRCPLHDDRNPSASVNTMTERFRCFSCDFNGDALDLIQLREGFDYTRSVEFAETVFSGSYRPLPAATKGRAGRRRPGVPEDSAAPVRGQRTLFQTGVRRRPTTGA